MAGCRNPFQKLLLQGGVCGGGVCGGSGMLPALPGAKKNKVGYAAGMRWGLRRRPRKREKKRARKKRTHFGSSLRWGSAVYVYIYVYMATCRGVCSELYCRGRVSARGSPPVPSRPPLTKKPNLLCLKAEKPRPETPDLRSSLPLPLRNCGTIRLPERGPLQPRAQKTIF